jgi:hypothetical protein
MGFSTTGEEAGFGGGGTGLDEMGLEGKSSCSQLDLGAGKDAA